MVEVAGEKKPRGRPPKSPEDRKGGNLTFRVRAGMREKLQASADARGLSISEEVERRLNLSFDIATSPHNEYVIRSAAESMNMVEQVTQAKWTDSAMTARMCHAAISSAVSVITAVHDKNEEDEEHDVIDAAGDVIGIRTALVFAGFPKESVIKFGRTDVDLAIDLIRRKLLEQVEKAQMRDPDGVTVMVDAEQPAGLGTTPPHFEESPEKLEAGLRVMDEKRVAKAAGRKSRPAETPRAD